MDSNPVCKSASSQCYEPRGDSYDWITVDPGVSPELRKVAEDGEMSHLFDLREPTNPAGHKAIIIENINLSSQINLIRELFAQFGDIYSISILFGSNENQFGQMLVEFTDDFSALKTIATLRSVIFTSDSDVTFNPMRPLQMSLCPGHDQEYDLAKIENLIRNSNECPDWRFGFGCENSRKKDEDKCKFEHIRACYAIEKVQI